MPQLLGNVNDMAVGNIDQNLAEITNMAIKNIDGY